MKMKILTLYLLIGLILPAAQGSETVEPAAAEQHQNKNSFEFVEKMKDAMASTLEPGLVVCVGRHDKVILRLSKSGSDALQRLRYHHRRHSSTPRP
jgi:hypothetical protein